MENLIADYGGKAAEDAQTYSFDVVLSPADVAVIVDSKESRTFTKQQVQLRTVFIPRSFNNLCDLL